MGFEMTKVRQKSEAERIIAQFHKRLNAGDFEAICHDAFKCSEFPNLRQDWQSALEDTRNRGGAFRSVLRADAADRAQVIDALKRADDLRICNNWN
jgi:hypothetical protein